MNERVEWSCPRCDTRYSVPSADGLTLCPKCAPRTPNKNAGKGPEAIGRNILIALGLFILGSIFMGWYMHDPLGELRQKQADGFIKNHERIAKELDAKQEAERVEQEKTRAQDAARTAETPVTVVKFENVTPEKVHAIFSNFYRAPQTSIDDASGKKVYLTNLNVDFRSGGSGRVAIFGQTSDSVSCLDSSIQMLDGRDIDHFANVSFEHLVKLAFPDILQQTALNWIKSNLSRHGVQTTVGSVKLEMFATEKTRRLIITKLEN